MDVTLGQTFLAHATSGDRIPSKLPDGRTLRDVLSELQAKFKPSEHSEYFTGKNRQGKETFYCYVKWQFIRKRLDDVVGVDGWIVEKTGLFFDEAGNPCVIGRMNILGVVKEAIGIGKAHEKWQGTKIENAIADLLKNCAEEFGIGRYLDDQRATIQYLWENSKGDEYIRSMARKLGNQYNLQLKEAIAENNAIADNKPAPKPKARTPENTNLLDTEVVFKPQPKQSAEPQELYPQHNPLFNAFAEEFKFKGVYQFTKETIGNLWTGYSRPGHLNVLELEELMTVVASQWGVEMGYFQKYELARTSLDGRVAFHKTAQGGAYTLKEFQSWAIAWRDAQKPAPSKKELTKV